MNNLATKTIREIAIEAPLTTRIFEEFKIDYCCGGRVPFAEGCATAGVDPTEVMKKIEALKTSTADDIHADQMTVNELISHIVRKHHAFTRNEIERLEPLMDKVCSKHGARSSELFEIQRLLGSLSAELIPHMAKEEMVLFPYIAQISGAADNSLFVEPAHFGTVKNPIRQMMYEHDAAGDILKKMRALSNDYTPPEDACPSYRGLYAGLEELERDLHQHIHLENNILFPKAVELETQALA
jgi:regulator of cell morphogenesis and NO signaling